MHRAARVLMAWVGQAEAEIFEARILKQVVVSSSRESSRPRDQTRVSCMAGEFFTNEPRVKAKEIDLTWGQVCSPLL